MGRLYDTIEWDAARTRTLERDGNRCTVGHLLGGSCHPVIEVHHLVPLSEGGDPYADVNLISICRVHHPRLEALRRLLLHEDEPWRCPHKHTSAAARRQCELRRIRTAA